MLFASIKITYLLTYLLQTSTPGYLRNLIAVQPTRSTRSSSSITLLQPRVNSSLKITNRSFRHAAPRLWNKLPQHLRTPAQHKTTMRHPITSADNSLALQLSHGVFHSRFKPTFFKIFSPIPFPFSRTELLDFDLCYFSCVSILTHDIDIANLSVRPSVCLSVRCVPVLYENGLTYCHNFFTTW